MGGWEREGTRGGMEGGIEGREGGSDDARQGESVSGGREGWGRVGWWRERTRNGWKEAWTARGKERREEASGGGTELGREGAREEGKQGRDGNFKGCILRRALASVQYIHKPSHNAALTGINYKLCIVMRHNVLFDRWMTWFYVMAIMDWVNMAWTRCIIRNRAKPGNRLVSNKWPARVFSYTYFELEYLSRNIDANPGITR